MTEIETKKPVHINAKSAFCWDIADAFWRKRSMDKINDSFVIDHDQRVRTWRDIDPKELVTRCPTWRHALEWGCMSYHYEDRFAFIKPKKATMGRIAPRGYIDVAFEGENPWVALAERLCERTEFHNLAGFLADQVSSGRYAVGSSHDDGVKAYLHLVDYELNAPNVLLFRLQACVYLGDVKATGIMDHTIRERTPLNEMLRSVDVVFEELDATRSRVPVKRVDPMAAHIAELDKLIAEMERDGVQ